MKRGPLLRLGDPVFRSPRACRTIFDLDPGQRLDHDAFDLATLALRRALGRWLAPGSAVVEVGCGPTPLLTGWLHARGHRVVAWEAHEESALRARKLLQRWFGARAPVVHGEAFGPGSAVEGEVVVANPPYVPTARGLAVGLDPARRHAWDGGEDGLEACRQLAGVLRGRFDGEVVVGGSWFWHRPGAVAQVLGLAEEARCGPAPGWAVRGRVG